MHIGNDGDLADDLARAVVAEGDDLVRAPVGEPEPPVVPARRLPEHDAFRQDRHGQSDHVSAAKVIAVVAGFSHAAGVGFEPTNGCPLCAFKAHAIGR